MGKLENPIKNRLDFNKMIAGLDVSSIGKTENETISIGLKTALCVSHTRVVYKVEIQVWVIKIKVV